MLMQTIPLHPNVELQKQLVAQEINNTENKMSEIQPIEMKSQDLFGVDFMDDRFDWVKMDTGAWLQSVQQEYYENQPSIDMPMSDDQQPAQEQSFHFPQQRRFVRATKRKILPVEHSPTGLVEEEGMQINTSSNGIRGIYAEFHQAEEEARLRAFEMRSQYYGAQDEDEDRLNDLELDKILAADDRARMKRFKSASRFMDFEAEEGEDDSLDMIFRRD